MSVELLMSARDRFLPMLRLVEAEYAHRVPEGFPVVVDSPDRGVVGIEIDPNYCLYLSTDGSQLFADVYFRESRNDTTSSASREKFGGSPFHDRRMLGTNPTDQQLRNLVAEVLSKWNFQPGIIHITDTD